MQSLNNKNISTYCQGGSNILAAVVAFLWSGGTGYTSAPTVGFTGGGGTGAAATATVVNGRVTGLVITAGGSGYTTVPTITFTGGGGSGAAATAVLTTQVVTSATVTNSGTDRKLTITDNTTYAAGDSRSNVNVSVFDKFGNKTEKQIGTSPSNVVIDVVGEGLNPVDGLDAIATVVSVEGKVKDGSVHDIGTLKASGNFVMEL